MEWLVKKSCCNKQDNRHVLMLCDAGGAIKMIAEVKSDFAVKVGDLLSPLQNALYCINREKLHTVKVLSASSYSPDEWERQCKVAGNSVTLFCRGQENQHQPAHNTGYSQ
ncbi:signal transduction protein PmrD [Escherichia coli]